MKPNRLLLAALLACLLPPALAEEAPAPAPEPAPAPRIAMHHDLEGLRIIHGGHNQPVKNAPYSAQAVTERLQQLADGNQIERRTRSASYRDSAGRTRHEVRNDKGELRTVTIDDPVAGQVWILNPQERSARRLPSRVDVERIARTARETARVQIERMRKEGRLPALERQGGDRVLVDVERENGRLRDGQRTNVRETVRVIRAPRGPDADRGAIGPGPQMGPMIAGAVSNAFADVKWSHKSVSRDLGTREFDGVKAEGKLRSYDIPAGEVGNRNPIVVADETWYAPELQVTVYSKHSDPRSGDYVYRLEGIKRGEPDAALFAVPPDYQVREIGKRAPGRNAE
ncbi:MULTISPECIES: hypothetical protein [unclassified Massilia]|uniref:hypothetical protein n=1 Tax=unclassified Massilia TaxID=2609279 RepID=UPI00177BF0B3|nr:MULTISPECIES: hypothetical protein [unclassified Massilia]MBD8529638.1 hypothetical protein [Massilia sp. CFBP 13647]MBD8673275.1 hypothetical protein [Massilia sp. CFBP 13721]